MLKIKHKKMKTNVDNIINEINDAISMISESYVFNSEPERMPAREQMPAEGEEEIEQPAPISMDERISQMREIALQGLQDYAHDVDNPLYDFYKKVWLETDKLCSEKKPEA